MPHLSTLAVDGLRDALDRRCVPHRQIGTAPLVTVLVKVGDVDLAADAVAMWPRPAWLVSLLGEAPFPPAEMVHAEDRADPAEWGTCGTEDAAP